MSSGPLEFELELGDDNVFIIEGFAIDNQGIIEIRVLVINDNAEKLIGITGLAQLARLVTRRRTLEPNGQTRYRSA